MEASERGPLSRHRRIHAKRRRKPARAAKVRAHAKDPGPLRFAFPEPSAGGTELAPPLLLPDPEETVVLGTAEGQRAPAPGQPPPHRRRHRHHLARLDARSLVYMGIALVVALLVFSILNMLELRDLAPPPPIPAP